MDVTLTSPIKEFQLVPTLVDVFQPRSFRAISDIVHSDLGENEAELN